MAHKEYGEDGSGRISLNVHLAVPQQVTPTTSSAQDGSHTPNTPELLNTLVNMQSGPFADYQAPPQQLPPTSSLAGNPNDYAPQALSSPDSSLDASSPTTSATTPSTPGSGMSVQQYRSQFIKEGLKLKVRQKLGGSPTSPSFPEVGAVGTKEELISPTQEEAGTIPNVRIKSEHLTEDDMVRRMRRRERNKVAATKCRNKKKHRTVLLMKESDVLESQNKSLKNEITKLEAEKKRLMDVLSVHEPSCAKKLRTMLDTSKEEAAAVEVFDTAQLEKPPPPEFRVPLPPASTVVSGNAYSVRPQIIPIVQVTSPVDDPPSFAEAMRMATQNPPPAVKLENIISSSTVSEEPMMAPPQNVEEIFAYNFDNGNGYHHHTHQASHFLAKRTLGHTYLDLDSRCIAL